MEKEEKMQGWLIVNAFLQKRKFQEIYELFQIAAKKRGVELIVKTNAEVLIELHGEDACKNAPDFVLFWDKDVALARRLEEKGFRLFNGAAAIEACDDKILSALALEREGVITPRTIPAPKTFEGVGYTDLRFLEKAGEILGFPMVIKEARGSFGQQVYLAKTREEAEKIVEKIGWKDFLMQEYIAESCGKDIRVNVVGGKVVSSILRENANDFRSNITGGGNACAHQISKEQAEMAIRACKAVGAAFAGVDILFGRGGKPLVCEVNSNLHFKSSLDCTGIDVSEKILDYIVSVTTGQV